MQLDARQDIAASQQEVWAEVTNFAGFERSAMRRGMEVRRLSQAEGLGAAWALEFQFRGRDRKARCKVTGWEPEEGFRLLTVSGGIEATATIDTLALSRGRTRLDVKISLSAKTLPARLLLQSLKLARGTLEGRLRTRVEDFARGIENRAPAG